MKKRKRQQIQVRQQQGLQHMTKQAARGKRLRFFLETSAVIYHRHGHSLMHAAVQQATTNGLVEVSNYIRMEYLRGVVLNLIELYFVIKESESVSDALIDWSQKVNQERKLKIVLMSLHQWLVGEEGWQDREKSMRRLGDLIVGLVFDFDYHFKGRAKDRLLCRLGQVRFPRRAFGEDMLLLFYERFKAIQTGIPDCLLCRFKATQQNALVRKGIDLHGPAQRQKYSKNPGYVQQAERVEEAWRRKKPCRSAGGVSDWATRLLFSKRRRK